MTLLNKGEELDNHVKLLCEQIKEFQKKKEMEKVKTSDDFNNKYGEYLEKGHYGCNLDKPEALEYLDNEFQNLIKIPGFKYSQIKSKFNFFRFYADNLPKGKETEIENKLKEIYT